MQNHYVIWSKYHFWTRNAPNSTKSPDLVMSGPVQEDPYGPIRAHKGPYGPQQLGHGSLREGYPGSQQTDSIMNGRMRAFSRNYLVLSPSVGPQRMLIHQADRIQKRYFDEMT